MRIKMGYNWRQWHKKHREDIKCHGFEDDAENRGKKIRSILKGRDIWGTRESEKKPNGKWYFEWERMERVNTEHALRAHNHLFRWKRLTKSSYFFFCFCLHFSWKYKCFNHFIAITLQNMCIFTFCTRIRYAYTHTRRTSVYLEKVKRQKI